LVLGLPGGDRATDEHALQGADGSSARNLQIGRHGSSSHGHDVLRRRST
jgi:hypothetical protein